MEFRILGPLEVRKGDRMLSLGGARQRAVLALLLTRAGEVVSTDALIDELWAGNPPASAAPTLQGYISHLRKALGPDVIVTRAPGYVVEVEPGQLDLHRFERLVEEGRQALSGGEAQRAADALGEALGLWRGPALADFAYEQFAQAEIARLEELRLAALERRVEADLALGRHAELVGELEGLVARHPLRERLRAHLVLALYRAGRQAEALDAYQAARRSLVEELGIDPSPALQELERAILRQDPSLDLAPVPARAAASSGSGEPALPALPVRSILVVPQDERTVDALLGLAEALARRSPHELILARLVAEEARLAEAGALLESRRSGLLERGVHARAAAFTSASPGDDLVRLASQQEVDLLVADAPRALLEEGIPDADVAPVLAELACDAALLSLRDENAPAITLERPVVVPFGGADHEWAAVEIGAWIAAAYGSRLRLLGTTALPELGRRDASRTLAQVALVAQAVAAIAIEPVLVPPGAEAVIEAAEGAGLVVVGLSPRWREEGLGAVRLDVLRGVRPPALLVRRGLRPGGLAPQETITHFTWTLARADG